MPPFLYTVQPNSGDGLVSSSSIFIVLKVTAGSTRFPESFVMSNQVRPQNWKALAPSISNFTHQSSTLPRLPLPPLEATLQRCKDSIRPFARSTEEFASVCRKIDDFGRPNGPGSILQQVLLQRRNEIDNWVEEFCSDDMTYLSVRDPVSSSPSISFILLSHIHPLVCDQCIAFL